MTHARGGRNDRKKTQNPNGNYSVIAYSHGHSTTNRRAARAAIHGGADRADCVVRRDYVDYIRRIIVWHNYQHMYRSTYTASG